MPDAEYRRVPGLSYSGAKKLLPPSTPAHYRYEQDHPSPPKRAYDLGHAAHRMVLGAGAELVLIDARDYRTKAAQEARDAAYDAGQTPLLPHEWAAAEAMARAVREHPLAGRLYADGRPEVSLFWTDPETGVPLKARLDWLPNSRPGRPVLVPDLKTIAGLAHPSVLSRPIDDYRYHMQAAMYLDGLAACGLTPPEGAAFLNVFVEKEPPHLVQVVQIDHRDIELGRGLNRAAMEIWRDCTTSGVWPGYPVEIATVSLPPYARRRHEESITDDEF